MKLLAAVLLVASTAALADPVTTCRKPEYAELKDATRKELSAQYCTAERWAEMNRKGSAQSLKALEEMSQSGLGFSEKFAGDSRDSMRAARECGVLAGTIADILNKRFKAKPPSCD